MLLNELMVFHGGPKKLTKLKPPIFVTTSKDDARWYAVERAVNDVGFVMSGDVIVKHPLKAIGPEGHREMLEIAKAAGVDFEEDPYFYSKDIEEQSEMSGDNINDLVYLSSFVKELKRRGYDSIHTYDVMTNYEIEVFILFDSAQFKISNAERVEASS